MPTAKATSAYDRLSVVEAAELLGLTKKAVEQAISRDAFPNAEREPNPTKPGRTLRVWLLRADVEAYAAKRGITLAGETAPRPDSKRPPSRVRDNRTPADDHQTILLADPQQTIWQELAEELSRENLKLKARVRELERRGR